MRLARPLALFKRQTTEKFRQTYDCRIIYKVARGCSQHSRFVLGSVGLATGILQPASILKANVQATDGRLPISTPTRINPTRRCVSIEELTPFRQMLPKGTIHKLGHTDLAFARCDRVANPARHRAEKPWSSSLRKLAMAGVDTNARPEDTMERLL